MEAHDPITFGKHKGTAIQDIPSDYLNWLLDEDWMEGEKYQELYEVIKYEMKVRDRSDGHFWEDNYSR